MRSLRKRDEFTRVQKEGQRHYSRHLLIGVLPTSSGEPRLGLVVSRKVDKRATVRNRIRRRLREAFRKLWPGLRPACDVVIVARPIAVDADYATLSKELSGVLSRAGFLTKIQRS